MKKWMILFALVFAFNFAAASVVVNNYSIGKAYSPFENITGEINWTIVDGEYDALITSNDGDEISLGEFLSKSGNLFTCSPPDCSKDYTNLSGSTDKTFDNISSSPTYAGFVLTGEDVIIQNLNFKLQSNFGESSSVPLVIEFFEIDYWEYDKFSETSFMEKNYGCYNNTRKFVGESSIDDSSLYCEMITLSDTGKIRVGADVSGSGSSNLMMKVYSGSGSSSELASCSYNPSSASYCEVSAGIDDIFPADNYHICVGATSSTGYKIYEENTGDVCGFAYGYDPEDSEVDYGIFAQTVKYASASSLSSVDFSEDANLVYAAQEIIDERYGGDCSSGCILPIAIKGVSQNLRIYDIDVSFTRGIRGSAHEYKIYNLNTIPVTLNFNSLTGGIVNLGALGFGVSKSMEYIVSLGGVELFSEFIEILPAPIILSVSPLDPPAGVPISFYADIEYSDNKTLKYVWNFGTNNTTTTYVPHAVYTYPDIKNYTLKLQVTAGGNLTSNKEFVINAINPKDSINSTLKAKRNALNDFISTLSKLPSWYGDVLRKNANIDSVQGELDRLDKAMLNAFTDADYIKIAKDLYSLDVPKNIVVDSLDSSYFITSLEDVDIEPVEIISGSALDATSESYAVPILNWQLENIDVKFSKKTYGVNTYFGDSGGVLTVYSYNVKSKSDGVGYFVINRPLEELYFKESVGARKAGDSATVIILSPGDEVSFDFYYTSGEPTSVFVSPKLNSLVIEAEIDTSCNYNYFCEEGEDSNTCRSDCKPVRGIIIYIILAVIFVLVLYTILQLWYAHRYEGHLFKDRRQLYNLVMYITNARVRGMSDEKIAAELKKQGWSSERVNYAIRKSSGQRTGMYEIVPINKITAYFRNKKAQNQFITNPQQQTWGNINKSGFPRRM